MAMQGGLAFQEKVARLLSKENGKAILRPNKPLVLKDRVANRRMKKGEATCITEMDSMMACWKQNNFVDALCSDVVTTFYTCVKNAQVGRVVRPDPSYRALASRVHKAENILVSSNRKGKPQLEAKAKSSQNKMAGRMPPKQANSLLRRYPNTSPKV